jgi:hypothetical protein
VSIIIVLPLGPLAKATLNCQGLFYLLPIDFLIFGYIIFIDGYTLFRKDIEMKNRIQRGTGVYECQECGKQTRDTGYGEAEAGLCAKCYKTMEIENALADGMITKEEYEKQIAELK